MKLIKKYKYIITIVLFVIVLIGCYFIKKSLIEDRIVNEEGIVIGNDLDTIKEDIDLMKEATLEEISEMVTVDIKGAVKKPGVYTIKKSSVVNDVIVMAGGLKKDADTSLINLAKAVSNEMVIVIYTKEEVKNSNVVDTVIKVIEKECVCPNIKNDGCLNTEITDEISNQDTKLININTATLDELMTLPGIGQIKAEAIISYRETNTFKTIEDILNVSGFGEKLYEQIKVYITA